MNHYNIHQKNGDLLDKPAAAAAADNRFAHTRLDYTPVVDNPYVAGHVSCCYDNLVAHTHVWVRHDNPNDTHPASAAGKATVGEIVALQ